MMPTARACSSNGESCGAPTTSSSSALPLTSGTDITESPYPVASCNGSPPQQQDSSSAGWCFGGLRGRRRRILPIILHHTNDSLAPPSLVPQLSQQASMWSSQASASSGFEAAAAFAEALKGAGWSPPDVTFDDSVCEPAASEKQEAIASEASQEGPPSQPTAFASQDAPDARVDAPTELDEPAADNDVFACTAAAVVAHADPATISTGPTFHDGRPVQLQNAVSVAPRLYNLAAQKTPTHSRLLDTEQTLTRSGPCTALSVHNNSLGLHLTRASSSPNLLFYASSAYIKGFDVSRPSFLQHSEHSVYLTRYILRADTTAAATRHPDASADSAARTMLPHAGEGTTSSAGAVGEGALATRLQAALASMSTPDASSQLLCGAALGKSEPVLGTHASQASDHHRAAASTFCRLLQHEEGRQEQRDPPQALSRDAQHPHIKTSKQPTRHRKVLSPSKAEAKWDLNSLLFHYNHSFDRSFRRTSSYSALLSSCSGDALKTAHSSRAHIGASSLLQRRACFTHAAQHASLTAAAARAKLPAAATSPSYASASPTAINSPRQIRGSSTLPGASSASIATTGVQLNAQPPTAASTLIPEAGLRFRIGVPFAASATIQVSVTRVEDGFCEITMQQVTEEDAQPLACVDAQLAPSAGLDAAVQLQNASALPVVKHQQGPADNHNAETDSGMVVADGGVAVADADADAAVAGNGVAAVDNGVNGVHTQDGGLDMPEDPTQVAASLPRLEQFDISSVEAMLQARVTELDELNRKLLVRNGLLACELQSVKETNAQDLCTLTRQDFNRRVSDLRKDAQIATLATQRDELQRLIRVDADSTANDAMKISLLQASAQQVELSSVLLEALESLHAVHRGMLLPPIELMEEMERHTSLLISADRHLAALQFEGINSGHLAAQLRRFVQVQQMQAKALEGRELDARPDAQVASISAQLGERQERFDSFSTSEGMAALQQRLAEQCSANRATQVLLMQARAQFVEMGSAILKAMEVSPTVRRAMLSQPIALIALDHEVQAQKALLLRADKDVAVLENRGLNSSLLAVPLRMLLQVLESEEARSAERAAENVILHDWATGAANMCSSLQRQLVKAKAVNVAFRADAAAAGPAPVPAQGESLYTSGSSSAQSSEDESEEIDESAAESEDDGDDSAASSKADKDDHSDSESTEVGEDSVHCPMGRVESESEHDSANSDDGLNSSDDDSQSQPSQPIDHQDGDPTGGSEDEEADNKAAGEQEADSLPEGEQAVGEEADKRQEDEEAVGEEEEAGGQRGERNQEAQARASTREHVQGQEEEVEGPAQRGEEEEKAAEQGGSADAGSSSKPFTFQEMHDWSMLYKAAAADKKLMLMLLFGRQTLRVTYLSTAEEVRQAALAMMRLYHQDKNPREPLAHEVTQFVFVAWGLVKLWVGKTEEEVAMSKPEKTEAEARLAAHKARHKVECARETAAANLVKADATLVVALRVQYDSLEACVRPFTVMYAAKTEMIAHEHDEAIKQTCAIAEEAWIMAMVAYGRSACRVQSAHVAIAKGRKVLAAATAAEAAFNAKEKPASPAFLLLLNA